MRYFGLVDKLASNQVWVFGSNAQGFHGAGAAAWAMFRDNSHCWRKYGLDKMANGTKGFYAVKGQGRGFQRGTEGASYAIQTIVRPGAKRSMSLKDIGLQIVDLITFAKNNPTLDFLISGAALDNPSLSGYTGKEIRALYLEHNLPDNILFPLIWK